MRARSVAEVVESKSSKYNKGDKYVHFGVTSFLWVQIGATLHVSGAVESFVPPKLSFYRGKIHYFVSHFSGSFPK